MNNKIIYQVDSFTNEVFKGNPAGVMILDSEIDSDLMQSIATEMNLSETAFVIPSNNEFKIRYFTPTVEVPICGHATLASAHILYSLGYVGKNEKIIFNAKLDRLVISLDDNWIKMSFPRFEIKPTRTPDALNDAIGTTVSGFYTDTTKGWNLAYLDSDHDLKNLTPDYAKIKLIIPELLIATSSDPENQFDFLVRCFAPNSGINEDPVTGSANCLLSTFWHDRLNKDRFTSKQVSTRTGIIKTQLNRDRVEIFGQAKTVFKAEFLI